MGADPAAAAALGAACGLVPEPHDPVALAEALRQGRFCVVVWADPQGAVAEALRGLTPPSVAAAAWCAGSQDLLGLFTRNRRKLLLVAAALITRADAADLDRLAARLAMPHPLMPPKAPVDDLAAVLARLTVTQLTDLRPIWDELQASSLAPVEASYSSADLDPLARLLADRQRATPHPTTDRSRSQLVALSADLGDTGIPTEAALLREQLIAVTGLLDQAPDSIGSAHVQIETAFATLLHALATETDLRRKAQTDLIAAYAPRGNSSLRQSVPARPGL